MSLPSPAVIVLDRAASPVEDLLGEVPNQAAVFLVWAEEGAPYLGRTTALRRRLLRLMRPPERPSRFLNLSAVARRVEYWLAGSKLETSLLFYRLAKRHFTESYPKLLKLRFPLYVKIILANQFPRSQVTARLGGRTALFFGPFRTRSSAEEFESQFLDLFQMRRCQEDLVPAPDHPGCIYGEMNMCLRPCQQVVTEEEYRSETERVVEFLKTGGASLVTSIAAARDRLSAEMEFEEAARQHKRLEKVQQVLKLRDELVTDVERLNGVAITRSPELIAVDLHMVLQGGWLPARRFDYAAGAGLPVSLDHQLRELMESAEAPRISTREKEEHLALLARWFYSTWRDGEWIPFPSLKGVPYRKLVRAISRVAATPGQESSA